MCPIRRLFLIPCTVLTPHRSVDIDWEYPQADDRGGAKADTANYVALIKEMRAAFGSTYGISVTLPTSYWYLQHFDLANIQPNIDW